MTGSPLPPLLVLTDRRQASAAGHTLPGVVRRAVEAGARAVILREKDLRVAERAVLAGEIRRRVLAPAGGTLLVATDVGLARKIGAGGVHLAAADEVPSRPVETFLIGRSCHDPGEVEAAAEAGCDYVTVSPVFETPSKPGYGPALGLDGLEHICDHARVPVYALGGVEPDRVVDCLKAGASGVAVMGAVMRAADPGGVVRILLEAIA